MVIERPLEQGQPRRIVYCSIDELTDNGNGTYSFKTLPNEALGFGSTVIVVDADKKLMFDNNSGVLYDWT